MNVVHPKDENHIICDFISSQLPLKNIVKLTPVIYEE